MTEIDITELLEDYVRLLEKGGVPRNSTESKIMLKASEEIKRLREGLKFQIQLAEDNNKSRLRYMDVVSNCRNLYEETCKRIREETVGECVCGMCKYDCDTSIGPSGDYMQECPGFEKDDCFELDINKFNNIVYKKECAE